MEFLTHDISWHVPHHVAPKIPWYNLRKATESLRENWGQVRAEQAAHTGHAQAQGMHNSVQRSGGGEVGEGAESEHDDVPARVLHALRGSGQVKGKPGRVVGCCGVATCVCS